MMMRNIGKELKRAVVAQDTIRTKNTDLFVSRLTKFLNRYIPKILDLEGMDAAEAASVIGGLQQGLIDLGLEEEVKKIRSAYRDELSAIATRYSIIGLEGVFSGADKALVETLINYDYSKVTNLISPYIDDVGSSVMRSVIGGQPINVQEILNKSTDVLESQVTTEVNTLLSSFSRTVSGNKASELGLNLFLYLGPKDKVTRPFCLHVLTGKTPPIYTREEIDNLNNDPDAPDGLDVFTEGGGYNCRHDWNALDERAAKEMGWKGGD